MFPTWLMGVGVYHMCRSNRLSSIAGWLFFAVPIVLLAGFQLVPHSSQQAFSDLSLDTDRLISTGQDYFLAALFSAHLIGFSTVSATFAPVLEKYGRVIRWIAGATFSIYLVHLPIMHLLAAVSPWPKSSTVTLIFLIAGTLLACFLFAEVFERRKDAWKRLIVGLLRLVEAKMPRARSGIAP